MKTALPSSTTNCTISVIQVDLSKQTEQLTEPLLLHSVKAEGAFENSSPTTRICTGQEFVWVTQTWVMNSTNTMEQMYHWFPISYQIHHHHQPIVMESLMHHSIFISRRGMRHTLHLMALLAALQIGMHSMMITSTLQMEQQVEPLLSQTVTYLFKHINTMRNLL